MEKRTKLEKNHVLCFEIIDVERHICVFHIIIKVYNVWMGFSLD